MVVVGPHTEPPTVLPNRTAAGIKDIQLFIDFVHDEMDENELFAKCESQFKAINFSAVMSSLNEQLEAHFPTDIQNHFLSILVLSIRHTAVDHNDMRILLILLYLSTVCIDSMRSKAGMDPSTIPVSDQDIIKLTEIVKQFPTSSIPSKIIKRLLPKLNPVMRPLPLYIDRTCTVFCRNNRQDSLIRDLTRGEETGRSVQVKLDEVDGHVIVTKPSGDIIADIDELLSGQRPVEFQNEVKSIIQDLNDVLPPPADDGPADGTTTEEEMERIELLPSENVRRMLQNGRMKRRSKKFIVE